ncbi:hypothetical protein L1049_001033 [Liquidambar formosana]|uniref:DDE Tnp4 domain-containing protein n=1 Tax=Liquidambar formosana TaxID=63359 RepID=A0AAP0R5T5_LIQFO
MEMELLKNMDNDGEVEERKDDKKQQRQRGGIKTMPFILANEICDRFATTGFHANMITYLTQKLNLPLVQASNTLTNFSGTSSFTPLIGALIADSFAGRFWTIIVASIIYELGLVSITISAVLPSLRPPPCPTQENCKEASTSQLWVLYICLLLTSVGTGGIRPCVVPFAADQFDMTRSAVARRSWNFFNWFYFSMGMATLTALTFIVYIQDNVGWGWGLGIPTVGMALSIVAFVIGSRLYKMVKPGGSPFVRLAQVIVAAVKKRKAALPADPGLLYENKELDAAISSQGRLLHTNQFKWVDKAAVVTDADATESNPPNLWRLATVHRVEELKSIIRMLPIWAAGILLVTSQSHQHSFTIQQARTMDRHLSHSFQIPPASLSIIRVVTMLIGLVLYERLFVPFARRFTGNPSGITCLQRMGIGFMVNILATIAASSVEIKRKAVASNHNLLDKPTAIIPISVFWLVPQFSLHGIAEVFMSVGHLEFLYDQSPESMRSTAVALNWMTTSVGNYIGTLLVSLVHKYSGKKKNWLPNRNLNRGRLEYYYGLVTGIQVINLIYYVICAYFYTYKPLEEVSEKSKENGVDLTTDNIPSKPLNGASGDGEDCIGALDGTHVRVKVSPIDAPRYRGKYYLVDAGYMLKSSLLPPYRGIRYHLKEYSTRAPKNARELFNHRHASLRNAIERCFGVLKKRFPIIGSLTDPTYSFDTQTEIILACSILHNFLMGVDPDENIIAEVDRELENGTQPREALRYRDNDDEDARRGAIIRDNIAAAMWNDYVLN